MAARLANAIADVDAVNVVMPVETNAVFAQLPSDRIAKLQSVATFGVWNTPQSIVRWMTSFDTTEDDVDRFADQIREAMADA
jgi:threonine aldolase